MVLNKIIKVKAWVIDQAHQTARRYNCYIDYAKRNEDGTRKEEDGYIWVYGEEVIAETEKAIQIRLGTGRVVGSYKGWATWIPKSQIGGVE